MEEKPAHNYVGILGALMAFLGLFFPYMDVWMVKTSMFDLLNDETHIWVLIPILLLAFIVLFATSYGPLTRLAACGLLVAQLIYTFTGNEVLGYKFTVSEVLQVLSSGFWIITVGLLLIILSPFLTGINEKMGGLLQGKKK